VLVRVHGGSLPVIGIKNAELTLFTVKVPNAIQGGQKSPEPMNNSISKAAYAGLGHCSVCGIWTKLEMWDEGLNGRFCSECFDHVVDAAELLASQGLVVPGPELKQKSRNS
jgi:hypothetical protein